MALPAGALIACCAVGALCVLAGLVGLVVWLCVRKKKDKQENKGGGGGDGSGVSAGSNSGSNSGNGSGGSDSGKSGDGSGGSNPGDSGSGGAPPPGHLERLRAALDAYPYPIRGQDTANKPWNVPGMGLAPEAFVAALAAYPSFFGAADNSKAFPDVVGTVAPHDEWYPGLGRVAPITSNNFAVYAPVGEAAQYRTHILAALWCLEYLAARYTLELGLGFAYVVANPDYAAVRDSRIPVYLRSTQAGYGAMAGVAELAPGRLLPYIVISCGAREAGDRTFAQAMAHELFHCVQRLVYYPDPDWEVCHEGQAELGRRWVFEEADPRDTYIPFVGRHMDVRLMHSAYDKWWYWAVAFDAAGRDQAGRFFSRASGLRASGDAVARLAELVQAGGGGGGGGVEPPGAALMARWNREHLAALLREMRNDPASYFVYTDAQGVRSAQPGEVRAGTVPAAVWAAPGGLQLFWLGFVYVDLRGLQPDPPAAPAASPTAVRVRVRPPHGAADVRLAYGTRATSVGDAAAAAVAVADVPAGPDGTFLVRHDPAAAYSVLGIACYAAGLTLAQSKAAPHGPVLDFAMAGSGRAPVCAQGGIFFSAGLPTDYTRTPFLPAV